MIGPTEWQPGEPLHPRDTRHHMNQGLFTFRQDNAMTWSDAADWPEQTKFRLRDGDELGDFIAEWHTWNNRSDEGTAA